MNLHDLIDNKSATDKIATRTATVKPRNATTAELQAQR